MKTKACDAYRIREEGEESLLSEPRSEMQPHSSKESKRRAKIINGVQQPPPLFFFLATATTSYTVDCEETL